MAMPVDRKTRELIRKRRNNLLRRHDEFAERYHMKIWLIIEMPSGRLYTYRSDPDLRPPTDEEIRHWQPPAIQKTPVDFRRGARPLSVSISPTPEVRLHDKRGKKATPSLPSPSDNTASQTYFHQWPRLRFLKIDVEGGPQE